MAAILFDLTIPGSPLLIDEGENVAEATRQASIATAGAAIAVTKAGDASASAGAAADGAGVATTQAGVATTQAGIATARAATASTQAGVATTQAGIATTGAATASTQAGVATTQAGIATMGASTATTQAGIATTQAGVATTGASTATTQAGLAQAALASVNQVAATLPAPYFTTLAGALADVTMTTGRLFMTDESGVMVVYKRATGSPGYTALPGQLSAKANTADLAATGGAALVGVSPAGTVQSMVDPALRRLARLPQNIAAMGGLHCFLLDSLTDGAGITAPTTWRLLYNAIARANLGYGGPGFQPYNYGTAVESGAAFYRTGSGYEFATEDGSSYGAAYGPYMPSGNGSYMLAAGAYFTWVPEAQWKTATLFYLKGPTMGAFTINDSSNSGTAITVDCYASTVQLAYMTLANPNAATGASYGHRFGWAAGTTNATGPVAIWGADYIYDATKYRPFNMARGGRAAVTVAASNAASWTTFMTQCAPKVAWLDGGMNDRTGATASAYSASMTTIIGFFQSVTAVKPLVVVVQSLDPSDAATTNWASYTAVRMSLAETYSCAYYDDRFHLGLPDYVTANAKNMMSDAVHPNGPANIGKAQGRGRFVGFNTGLTDPGKLAYVGSGGTAVKIYTGTLAEVDGVVLIAPISAVTGFTATMSGNVLTIIGSGSGTIANGQLFKGTGIPAGTIILSPGTGSGGAGTYNVNTSATVSSAVSVIGYTVTPVTLYNLGLGNPYNTAAMRLNMTGVRTGTTAVRRQRADFALTNATIYNSASLAGTVTQTDEFSTTAGDGNTISFLVRVLANGNLVQVTLTPLDYAGSITVTGSYVFPVQNYTGTPVIQN